MAKQKAKTPAKKPAKKTAKKTAKKPAKKAPAAARAANGPGVTGPTARQRAEERRWEASQDLDVLRRAEEVRTDPGRMKAARVESTRMQKALAKASK